MYRLPIAVVTAVSTFAISQLAFGADLPLKAPAEVAAPAHNWTGFYIGANAGYSWGTTSVDYSESAAGLFGFGSLACRFGCSLPFSMSRGGGLGGLQLGFNYQTDVWVWGVEADYAWRNADATVNSILNSTQDTLTITDKQAGIGTVRGRIGIAPAGASNWLFYFTGGLAYGKVEHSVTQFCNIFCNETLTFSDSRTKTGWTVGGGLEVALNPNWSIGAEYLYTDLGTDTLTSAGNGAAIPATSVTFHDRSNIARIKLNYQFGLSPGL
jgi:outer membrane immunogenic protein